MTTATPVRRTKRAKPVAPTRRIGFAYLTLARACEASAPGEAPTAFRVLAAGENATDKGLLDFTPRSAKLVMAAFLARGNPLAMYYEHEDRVPLEKRGGCPMKGACSAPSSDLAIRGPSDAPECWAESVAWTAEAQRQITTGERRQISPVAAFDEETREVLEILNVSLCGEGATHNGTLLASRGQGGPDGMDDIIDKIMAALEAGDFEAAEDLVQQAEAAGGAMGKMARAAMKGAKGDAALPPPVAKPDAAAAKQLAASRGTLAAPLVDVGAFDRAVESMNAATRRADDAAKRSDRATVTSIIAANRDMFDVVDERQHLTAADPVATERYVSSLTRKVKAGVVALSKAVDEPSAAKPGGDKPKPADALPDLTPGQRKIFESFNRGKDTKFHITEAEWLATQTRHGYGPKPETGKA